MGILSGGLRLHRATTGGNPQKLHEEGTLEDVRVVKKDGKLGLTMGMARAHSDGPVEPRILSVQTRSLASQHGALARGDILLALNELPVHDAASLTRAAASIEPLPDGTAVVVRVERYQARLASTRHGSAPSIPKSKGRVMIKPAQVHAEIAKRDDAEAEELQAATAMAIATRMAAEAEAALARAAKAEAALTQVTETEQEKARAMELVMEMEARQRAAAEADAEAAKAEKSRIVQLAMQMAQEKAAAEEAETEAMAEKRRIVEQAMQIEQEKAAVVAAVEAETRQVKEELERQVAEAKAEAARQKAAADEALLAKKDALRASSSIPQMPLAFQNMQTWAGPVGQVDVEKFFDRRQATTDPNAGVKLQIESSVQLQNAQLQTFCSAGPCHLAWPKAQKEKADTLLFHGCPKDVALDILNKGLVTPGTAGVAVRHGSMLGRGIYGAPDPRKSIHYCDKGSERYMFICRFNLSSAQHAGPSTNHRNRVFDEFCVADSSHVAVLWMLKIK